MQINIIDVMTPSQAQEDNNILGSVTIEITADDDSPIVRLSGITVKKNKSGERFLAMPSFQVGQGDKKKWLNHFSLFPGKGDESAIAEKQRNRIDKLTKDVLRVLDNGGTRKRESQTATTTATKKETPMSKKQEPWDV